MLNQDKLKMSKIGTLFILVIFSVILFLLNACKPNILDRTAPKVVNGVLDLSAWDFSKDGPVALSGEWEFYWHSHLKPNDFLKENPPVISGLIEVPGDWNDFEVNGEKISGDGYATYRLRIILGETRERMAFKFLDMAVAFSVYVNGKHLTSAGIPGKTSDTTVPQFHPHVVDFNPDFDRLDVIIQVSNFHHRRGGAWEVIHLGLVDDIRAVRQNALNFNFFLFGSILMMGIYHIGLFALRKKEKSALYFGITCFLIAARSLVTGERYIIHLFPTFDWEFHTKISYLTFYLGVPVFTEYFRTLFPKECSKHVFFIINIVGILFSVTVLLTTAKFYTHTAPLFQIFTILAAGYGFYVLFLALKHKRQGALVFLVGFVILFLTLVNDILYSNLLVKTGQMIQFGLFVFIFSQVFLLSFRFSKAFSTVEEQRGILKATNASYQKEIVERKRTEKALIESEERYRTLFEQAPDAIFLEDLKDSIIDGNPGTCRLMGSTRGELLNMTVADLQAPEVRGKSGNVVKSELEKYQGEPFEGLYLHKNGTHIPVEIKTVPLTQEGWVLSIVRDISERKRAEEEKIMLAAQLQQVQKMEAIATLAGGISHQFNNAITVVVGNIDLLCLEASDNEKINQFIGPIKQSIHRMTQLNNQLLAYARGGKYQVEKISIGDFISNTLPLIQYNIKSTIGVETDIPYDILSIKADLTQMQMVMSAIISNASEAFDSTGCIRIMSRNRKITEENSKDFGGLKPGPYVSLTIEDDGKGMDEETRKRVFEPFFTTKFQGRGLGMAAAYGIIKNHDGWISIASELNQGTTVRFYLPAISEMS
jgi:PAS domain S-box-containing protein